MKTFQDLQALGQNEAARAAFCKIAVDEFRVTPEYKRAQEGEAYYNKHNLTIEHYQKFLYSLSGGKIEDIWSANYKLKTLFFRRLVTQQVQYVTGNGLTLMDAGNKEKLGKDFDFKLQQACKSAMAQGRAFGFWNLDHMEVFGYADTPHEAGFCPLYDEKTSKLEAGIRFWNRLVGNSMIFRATLYEADGYTEYKQIDNDAAEVVEPKRGYKQIITTLPDGTIETSYDENYSSLPIIPLYVNDSHESELVGIRECIDCYDFIKSGLANTIDDNADVFWLLQNTGGMEDKDLAKFIHRIKTVKAAAVEGSEGASAEAHTIDVPFAARQTMLDILRRDIYEDFQALDVETLSAAQKTAQEIQAAYQSQDNKCADFEYYVCDFVRGIMNLAGIDDEPTFIWNRVTNQLEQTQMVLQAAAILPAELVIKHLPFLTPEEADEAIAKLDMESYNQFNAGSSAAENDEPEDDDTDGFNFDEE